MTVIQSDLSVDVLALFSAPHSCSCKVMFCKNYQLDFFYFAETEFITSESAANETSRLFCLANTIIA